MFAEETEETDWPRRYSLYNDRGSYFQWDTFFSLQVYERVGISRLEV